ncbi:sporulation protein [Bacillus velezensis]|uniref:sporulation protein n=1 Tax=Bacillus velezensis TaxID=492670 RepID=UPI0010FC3AE9|nr:sporulation protein [Bacillus velezensis]QCT29612.1 sporulation protein [Bacillus velezensis]
MKISGPFFHDTSQENLYLKSELSRCRKLISEFEASYFHQKNNKLQEENANIKERLHKLSEELEAMAQKHKQTSDTERSLHEIRAGLLDKIVILQELLQQETFRRKNEMEEKHRLHLTNVKFEEENKNLHTRIRSLETVIQTERTSHEDMKQRYHAAADENTRLQTQMIEKEYQLKHIKIEINHMRDRILETKERLVEIEKTKEKLFQETILSYKRQLDESDAWIAGHFADIDSRTAEPAEQALEIPSVSKETVQAEDLLKAVTEQVISLQKQFVQSESRDQSFDEKLDALKERADGEKPFQKYVVKLEKKPGKEASLPQNKRESAKKLLE